MATSSSFSINVIDNFFHERNSRKSSFAKYGVTKGSRISIAFLDSRFSHADETQKFICMKQFFQGTVTGYVYECCLCSQVISQGTLAANLFLTHSNFDIWTSLKHNEKCFCKAPKWLKSFFFSFRFIAGWIGNVSKRLGSVFVFHECVNIILSKVIKLRAWH